MGLFFMCVSYTLHTYTPHTFIRREREREKKREKKKKKKRKRKGEESLESPNHKLREAIRSPIQAQRKVRTQS